MYFITVIALAIRTFMQLDRRECHSFTLTFKISNLKSFRTPCQHENGVYCNYRHQSKRLYAIPERSNNGSSWKDTFSSISPSTPPVIPFDFARDDVVIAKNNTGYDPKKILEANIKEAERRRLIEELKSERRLPPEFYDENARPAGYDRMDEDEEEERFTVFNFTTTPNPLSQFNDTNDPAFVRFLKEVYIGSPTDGRRRQQARFIVRSVTLISFAIGVIFTAIWYAFPGKFISFRGNQDFSARYSTDYIDPDFLLQNDYQRYTEKDVIGRESVSPAEKQQRLLEQQLSADSLKKSEYLDDGVVKEEFAPDRRVPLPKRASSESIPGRSAEL